MILREKLSEQYISGKGIEIGGLHFPLVVQPGTEVTYVDVAPAEELKKLHTDVAPKDLAIVVDDAEMLMRFGDGQQDFVIANHVLEHCEDVMGTLKNWLRVLKPGGIIYAAVPDKDKTFDKDRAITTLLHLLEDHYHGAVLSRLSHYKDWYANATMEKKTGEALEAAVKAADERHQNIHFHVWDLTAMKKMFSFFKEILPYEIVTYLQNDGEVIWILRKNQ